MSHHHIIDLILDVYGFVNNREKMRCKHIKSEHSENDLLELSLIDLCHDGILLSITDIRSKGLCKFECQPSKDNPYADKNGEGDGEPYFVPHILPVCLEIEWNIHECCVANVNGDNLHGDRCQLSTCHDDFS